MKRSRFLIFLLTLSLFACNSEPNWIEYETQPNEETAPVDAFEYVHTEDKPYSINAIHGNDDLKYYDGYIYFFNGNPTPINNTSQTIKRLNTKTGEVTSVCPDPVCTHNDPSCNLYGFSSSFYIAEDSIFFKRGYQYYVRDDEDNVKDIITRSDYVRYDMQEEKIDVYEDYGENLNYYNYEVQIFTDGVQFYYDYVYNEEDEGYYFRMCRRDLESGEVKVLNTESEVGEVYERLLYSYDGRIYCTNGVDIYSFDLNGENRTEHCKGDFGGDIYSDGKSLYYEIKNTDGDYELWKKEDFEADGKSLGITCRRWNLTENYIYYTTDEEAIANNTDITEHEIYRCDHDGNNKELVFTFDGEYSTIHLQRYTIVGNYIYAAYYDENEKNSSNSTGDYKIMRIDCTDGSVYIIDASAN